MDAYPIPQPEYAWRFYRRETWGKPPKEWTAWVDVNNAHVLAWNSARPDATVTFWWFNPDLARWQFERSYTAADAPPFPQLAPAEAQGDDFPDPPATSPGQPPPSPARGDKPHTAIELVIGTFIVLAGLATLPAFILIGRRRERREMRAASAAYARREQRR